MNNVNNENYRLSPKEIEKNRSLIKDFKKIQ